MPLGTSFGLAKAAQQKMITMIELRMASNTGFVSQLTPATGPRLNSSSGVGARNSPPGDARTVSALTRRSLQRRSGSQKFPRRSGRRVGLAAVPPVDRVAAQRQPQDDAYGEERGHVEPAVQQPPDAAVDRHPGEKIAGDRPHGVGEVATVCLRPAFLFAHRGPDDSRRAED